MTTALLVLAAIFLDWLLGEPRCLHPLVGFGSLAKKLERKLNNYSTLNAQSLRGRGVLALLLLTLPFTITAAALTTLPHVGDIISVLILYFAVGHRSLHDHARPVASTLLNGNEDEARHLTSHMVSRDPDSLNIVGATTESVLENGNDSVFGTIFWFVLAGSGGVVLHRLVNTLDAMWGYRNDHYRYFGWATAHLDDLLNYIPARLTALTYALLGNTRQAINCWRNQAPDCDSPNAGPVMAAGAGALDICIGGPAYYHGKLRQRPHLGTDNSPDIADIERALKLVRHSVWLWLGLLIIAGGISHA